MTTVVPGKRPEWFAAAAVLVCRACAHVYARQGERRRFGQQMRYPKGTERRCPACGDCDTHEVDTLLLGEGSLARLLELTRKRVRRYGVDGNPRALGGPWSKHVSGSTGGAAPRPAGRLALPA